MALAWPVVQLQSDLSAAGLREVLHGGAFGDVLSNEPVRVLVGATLPRMIWSGEVEGRVGGALDVTIAVELGPVVDSDGLEQVPLRADQLNDAAVRGRDRSRAQLTHQDAPGHALDERDDAVAIRGADDRVHLPVADLLAQLDSGRTLGDVTLSRETAALLGASVAFPPLGGLSQQAKQSAALSLVPPDEPVDRLVTNLESAFEMKPAADLLWTQPFTQESDDQIPMCGDEPAVAATS